MLRWPQVLTWVVMGCSSAFTLGAQLDSAAAVQEKTITATRIDQPILIELEASVSDIDFPVEFKVLLPSINSASQSGSKRDEHGLKRKRE